MPLSRAAVVLVLAVPVLGAQQVARPAAPDAGSLVAEVHYTTGGDAWFTTNKPAYVALFDVSRGGVAQLYPTFTAQATELSGRRFGWTCARTLRSRAAGSTADRRSWR
jgi:hypothetical protein